MTGTIRRGKITRADLALWDGRNATYSRPDATGGTTSGLAVGNEVDVLQVFGSGTARTRGSIVNAQNYMGSSSATLILAPGTWAIDDNLTLPSNLSLRIPAGCVLSVSSGKTLTIAGQVYNDSPTWTGGAGTVSVTGGIFGPYITDAESSAGVTPTNYAYAPLDPRRYGLLTTNTAAQNVTALTAVLAVAAASGGGVVTLPPGSFDFNAKLTIQSNTQLKGTSMGYGVFGCTVLNYTGTGIAIQVDGYYSRLSDLFIKQSGTGTIGVYVTATQFMMERVSIIPATTVGFSTAGYQSSTAGVVFTHILKRCYIYGHVIGVDFYQGNNFILDGCFLETNGTNLRAAYGGTVTNLVICNGCVIELFGTGAASASPYETNDSVCVDLYDTTGGVLGFTCRDSYFEVNGSAVVAAANQLGINMRKCFGADINTNYWYGGGQATRLIVAQGNAKAIRIGGNYFGSVNGYAVQEDSGSQVEFGINSAPSPTTGVVNRVLTPTPTSLTVVNGTGGATHSLTFDRQGNKIDFTLTITVTGDCTTASTAGTTYFAIPSPMPNVAATDLCSAATTDGTTSYGNGAVATNSRIYTPAWSAVNKSIVVKGSYRCAQI